ncbi:MAG TPA: hypothetical protein VM848_09485 [Acidimicrobiia bacterium]|nr:hypothetical protein [Acidimicrobiia bacterium]
MISTIGTPLDVTAQELRLEAFSKADDETIIIWSNRHREDHDTPS